MAQIAQVGQRLAIRSSPGVMLAGMTLALVLFYRGGLLPLEVLGLLVFGVLALLRPDLALLFVPLTVPLHLIPATIDLPALRENTFLFPLHEVVLLVVAAATAAHWLLRRATRRQAEAPLPGVRRPLWYYLPHALFVLAGVIGVMIAVPEGRGAALREFRWLIAEPLLFYGLLLVLAQQSGESGQRSRFGLPQLYVWTLLAFLVSGVVVALVGLLQFVGLDLVWLFGEKTTAPFADNVVQVGALRRVSSVMGHPNNLGLYLERLWPLAVALALVGFTWRSTGTASRAESAVGTGTPQRLRLLAGLAALLCLGGVFVSFSRGAWLGSLVALAVLAIGWMRERAASGDGRWSTVSGWLSANARWLIAVGVVTLVIGGVGFALRGGENDRSTGPRLLLWRESVTLITLHPLGLGLDQFYYYHNPDFGRSLIDPSLIGTSEQYAAHPHNLVLDIWLRMGPLGLVAFGWLLLRFIRHTLAALRLSTAPPVRWLALGMLATMAAALTHGMVDSFYFWADLALLFWFLILAAETLHARTEAGQPAREATT